MAIVLPESLGVSASDLSAPLYVAWQLTNECDLSCRHCIEESGPGRAFPDELSRGEALKLADAIAAADIPYAALSGGEPLLHPHFFEIAGRLSGAGVGLKVETNGQRLSPESCARLGSLGVKSVQVSLDGDDDETFRSVRPGGSLRAVLDGIKGLRAAGVEVEVNFAPIRRNAGRVAAVVDLAWELGARAFYTGRLMYTGRAERSWETLAPSEEQYSEFFAVLKDKARQYEGRMRVCCHELGLVEELRYRLENPAALFIVLPNGKVKLINALPFVCGDVRRQSLAEIWSSYQKAWRRPEVSRFVEELGRDPQAMAKLHDWAEL